MYAIVDVKGFQFKVQTDAVIRVPSIPEAVGSKIVLDRVLMIGGGDARIGTPLVEGARIEAEVVRHGRGRKVIVGKFKRRRDYHRKNGHRQNFTEIRITSIG